MDSSTMQVGIYTNVSRDPKFEVRDYVTDLFRRKNVPCKYDAKDYPACDIIISLGGDGTFLQLAHIDEVQNKPCIGVNLGSVGFLAEIEVEQLASAVDRLLAGDYKIENRTMLEMSIYDSKGDLLHRDKALNDLTLIRQAGGRIITTDISINGMHADRIPGDGVIVATATGSTAYSLAAGGPIVYPSMDVFVITPICPHSLHNRSYLAPATGEIRLDLVDIESESVASVDGRNSLSLHAGHIIIRKAPQPFKFIRLESNFFYQRLGEKIQERGTTYEKKRKEPTSIKNSKNY